MGGKTVAYFYDPDVGNFHYGKALFRLILFPWQRTILQSNQDKYGEGGVCGRGSNKDLKIGTQEPANLRQWG